MPLCLCIYYSKVVCISISIRSVYTKHNGYMTSTTRRTYRTRSCFNYLKTKRKYCKNQIQFKYMILLNYCSFVLSLNVRFQYLLTLFSLVLRFSFQCFQQQKRDVQRSEKKSQVTSKENRQIIPSRVEQRFQRRTLLSYTRVIRW